MAFSIKETFDQLNQTEKHSLRYDIQPGLMQLVTSADQALHALRLLTSQAALQVTTKKPEVARRLRHSLRILFDLLFATREFLASSL